MAKKEAPLSALQEYIPGGSQELVWAFLKKYNVHLTITRGRKTILGDYRHAIGGKNHRISVNGTLNRYSFLVTLIHELAHLVTFIQFNNGVASHGAEWKHIYRNLLLEFLDKQIFPIDIKQALERSLHNLPASSCADEVLTRVLKTYDARHNDMVMIEQISDGGLFQTAEGKIFKKGKQSRKRFYCEEVKTGKLYLFSPVYDVKPLSARPDLRR